MSTHLPASTSPQRFRLVLLPLAAANLYAAVVVLYLLLRALTGERLWPVAFLNTFAPWLLLPALVLLPLAIRTRRRALAILCACGAVAFAGLFGELFLPHSAAESPPGLFAVMTFNVGDDRADPGRLAAVLRESGADVIVLLELGEDPAAALDSLADLYPYRVAYPLGIPGKGLLSRYPILENNLFSLQAGLPHLRALLDVDGQPITLIAGHPPPPALRPSGYTANPAAAPVIAALAEMAAANAPAVLLGDFNLTDQNDNYGLLRAAGLTDVFRAVGWGFGMTWPARLGSLTVPPLVRIDYVWITRGLRPVRAWVGPDAGSDHFPVMSELAPG